MSDHFSITFRHTSAVGNKLRETHCSIFQNNERIADGYAVCAPEDNFCKATGRKTALNRTLDQSDLLRRHRAIIWDLYLTTWGYRGCSRFGRS